MGKEALQRISGIVGNRFFEEVQGSTTPGTPLDLIDFTVGSSVIRVLHQLVIVCRFYGTFVVTDDGAIIGAGSSGPGESNISFVWAGGRVVDSNHNLKVTFTADSGFQTQPVDAYLQMTDAI